MNYSKVAVRYAKSLYILSQEKNLVDEIKDDMLLIEGVLKSVPDFIESISNPIAKTKIKKAIIKAVFEGKVNAFTFNFLNLIIFFGNFFKLFPAKYSDSRFNNLPIVFGKYSKQLSDNINHCRFLNFLSFLILLYKVASLFSLRFSSTILVNLNICLSTAFKFAFARLHLDSVKNSNNLSF